MPYYTLTQPPPLRVPFDPWDPAPFPEAPPPRGSCAAPEEALESWTPAAPPCTPLGPARPRVVRTDRLALHIAPPAPAPAAARWRGRGRGGGVAPRPAELLWRRRRLRETERARRPGRPLRERRKRGHVSLHRGPPTPPCSSGTSRTPPGERRRVRRLGRGEGRVTAATQSPAGLACTRRPARGSPWRSLSPRPAGSARAWAGLAPPPSRLGSPSASARPRLRPPPPLTASRTWAGLAGAYSSPREQEERRLPWLGAAVTPSPQPLRVPRWASASVSPLCRCAGIKPRISPPRWEGIGDGENALRNSACLGPYDSLPCSQ